MADSSTFLAELGPTTGPAVYSARSTAGFVSGFGNWGSCLYRGGDYGRSHSNKLMRLRVVLQAVAIAVLVAAIWWKRSHL